MTTVRTIDGIQIELKLITVKCSAVHLEVPLLASDMLFAGTGRDYSAASPLFKARTLCGETVSLADVTRPGGLAYVLLCPGCQLRVREADQVALFVADHAAAA